MGIEQDFENEMKYKMDSLDTGPEFECDIDILQEKEYVIWESYWHGDWARDGLLDWDQTGEGVKKMR